MCNIFRCSYIECVYIYSYFILLMSWPLYHYIMASFVSCYNFWLNVYFIRYKYNWPSVSVENWFQDPPWIPKSLNSQFPYIKCHRTTHTVGPPVPRIHNYRSKILFSLIYETFFSCYLQNSVFDFCLRVWL